MDLSLSFLPPIAAGHNHTIHILETQQQQKKQQLTLHDISFGDVFLCSGQSNMQMSLNSVFNGTKDMGGRTNQSQFDRDKR